MELTEFERRHPTAAAEARAFAAKSGRPISVTIAQDGITVHYGCAPKATLVITPSDVKEVA